MCELIRIVVKIFIKILKIILILSIILIFPIVFIWLADILLTESSALGFIEPSQVKNWMNHYVTVLGGALTFLGVIMTIRYEKQKSIMEKAIEYKPIIQVIQYGDIPNTTMISFDVLINNQNNKQAKNSCEYECGKYDKHTLVFKNFGRGETTLAYLDEFIPRYKEINWTDKKYLYTDGEKRLIGEILAEQYFKINIKLPLWLVITNEVFNSQNEILFPTKLTISYFDMFNEYAYDYTVSLDIKAKLQKNQYKNICEKYTKVKVEYDKDSFTVKSHLIKQNN